MSKQANLFLNGTYFNYKNRINKNIYTIAADGGVYNSFKNNIKPALVIGDGDSLIQGSKKGRIENIPYISAPDQNYTDFEKALDYLYSNDYSDIYVYCFDGDRLDHMLAGLSAVTTRSHLNVTLFNRKQKIVKLPFTAKLKVLNNTTISLIPFPSAKKVYTSGLHWNIAHQNISLDTSISISNYAVSKEISISYSSGNLFAVISL